MWRFNFNKKTYKIWPKFISYFLSALRTDTDKEINKLKSQTFNVKQYYDFPSPKNRQKSQEQSI